MVEKLRQTKVAFGSVIFFLFLAWLSFWLTARPVGSQSTYIGPGSLTPYLMGHWDTRWKRTTVFYVLNPTSKNLNALFVFFNNEEKPLKAVIAKLSGNDVVEVDARRYLPVKGWGVVKIFSLNPNFDVSALHLEPGIKGFQKELFLRQRKYVSIPYKYNRSYSMWGIISPWPWPVTARLPHVNIVAATEANLKEIPQDVVDAAERSVIQEFLSRSTADKGLPIID